MRLSPPSSELSIRKSRLVAHFLSVNLTWLFADSQGRYTLSSSATTVTLAACSSDFFSIETSSGLIGAVSNATIRAGPSISQVLAVRTAARGVRLAQYNLSGSIAFEAVQKVRLFSLSSLWRLPNAVVTPLEPSLTV